MTRRARSRAPGEFTSGDVSTETVALLWGVRVADVRAWIQSDLLVRDHYGRLTRAAMTQFLESASGYAALVEARSRA